MIEMDERRPWDPARHLLVIGPGGAGKSTLGSVLGPLLARRVVDLDQEFSGRIGHIGAFIPDQGYERYKLRNAALAQEITAEADTPILLVTSSGFLTPDNPATALASNERLLAACHSLCLLPSRDLEQAVAIIVERQVTRPFAREREQEEAVIRERYPLYARRGDLAVFSAAPPGVIARAVARRLSPGA